MKVHFIGIGGIGVSALARYYLAKGGEISGSDLTSSEITDALSKLGVKIFIGKHKAENISTRPGLVVYSPAVQPDNPELKGAKRLGIVCKSYPQALGDLTKKYFTIAVCGSHGKSTVAAMLGLILTKAGLDPTVIVGTKLKEFGDSNFRAGKNRYLVMEADEHFSSFLNYFPKIIVLTSLEKDHLDFYKNFKNYVLTFKKFISHLPKDGILVANKDDKNIPKLKTATKSYSLKQGEAEKLRKILKIPGEFNVSNALAALTTARVLKIPDRISFKTLSEYRGSWRRFEERDYEVCGQKLKIIHDYAHHPTQVFQTIAAARRKFPKMKVWSVFQPHQYQRTHYLFNDFVRIFSKAKADKIIVTDIYDVAGREDKKIKKIVSSKKLVESIRKRVSPVEYVAGEKLPEYIKKNLREINVLLIMGAGDIYELPERLNL